MTELPELRPPTRYERCVYAVSKRWPQSYVEARLAHHEAAAIALMALSLADLNQHAANALAKAKAMNQ